MPIMPSTWNIPLLFSLSSIFCSYFADYYTYTPHCHGISFGVLACPWHTTMSGCLYGHHMTSIWSWWNPSRTSLWVRGPIDPKEVPWDQNFSLKNFFISSSKDVILCDLGIWFAKNPPNLRKLVIFTTFPLYIGIVQNLAVFLIFESFLQNKSPNHIK